jgi:LCP family protein required for cell wall assembly
MKYKDLNNLRKPVTGKRNYSWLLKLVGVALGLALILFSLKILLSPITTAIASFLGESSTTLSFFTSRHTVKAENGVTNVLLLGVDERLQGDLPLTDTIILAGLREEDKNVTMISIPRDLWIQVPAFGEVISHYTKINGVYSLGEEYGYPGGGIELLKTVITKHFEVPVHYYAEINFEGFEQAVDAVGGIDIYVEQDFVDYQYPRTGYENAAWSERWEVLSFEQGWQHMDGAIALKYARSRHAFGPEGSDFARARRQQRVILALKDKILTTSTLTNLSKLKELFLAFTNYVETSTNTIFRRNTVTPA